MKRSEVARLLGLAAAYDARRIDENGDVAVEAWGLALDGLTYDACRDAIVAHYRAETEPIKPAHIRRLASTRVGSTAVDLPQCERCHGIHDRTEPCDVLRPLPDDVAADLERLKTTLGRVPAGEAS